MPLMTSISSFILRRMYICLPKVFYLKIYIGFISLQFYLNSFTFTCFDVFHNVFYFKKSIMTVSRKSLK